ncbi:hypothetical protein K9N68_37255 (plasmid) [Kovacikia minuta CCNUW1]|uniref:hypothetical protein n=1 Tax=Kovacikia minuta TaxID=2931930 RepID=UPI001CCD8B01|nr:hypothetical protein [Kovacikia minuta]UBF29861.1 hypothetical protein K9N68_37255 [Kovacikia minuta CCNUW1]
MLGLDQHQLRGNMISGGTGRIAGIVSGGLERAGAIYRYSRQNPIVAVPAIGAIAGAGYLAYNKFFNPPFDGGTATEQVFNQTSKPRQQAQSQADIAYPSGDRQNYYPNSSGFQGLPNDIPKGYLEPEVLGKERLRLLKENEKLEDEYKINSIYQRTLGYGGY